MIVVVGGDCGGDCDYNGAAAGEPSIGYDPYIPVTVTWPGYRRSLDAPVSLCLSGQGGFLELKFGVGDRRLVELVLVYGVVSVRDEPLPVTAFAPGPAAAAVALSRDEKVRHALSGDLPLPQIAYRDALEIRFSDRPPEAVTTGPSVGFGALATGELTSIYVKYTAGQRADLIAGCRRPPGPDAPGV